jgi:biopolymer transport protein ExbD
MKIVRRPDKPVRIEMLPLIDIVFLLLIFFIYAMLSMAVHRGLDLDLPESAVTTISDQSTWAISIKRRNTATDIYLEEQRIQLDDLTKILADQPDERKVQPVLLFADEEVSYQQLFTVLDALQQAGYRDISLQANQQ